MKRAAHAAVIVGVAAACGSIESQPLSTAPLNASSEHPCDRYGGLPVSAGPREGRCEVPGRPTYDFVIVVDVPETSHYAAGHTFVLTSADLSRETTNPLCRPPSCLTLPPLGNVRGEYSVTAAVSATVGFPLRDGTSIPVRARYVAVGRDQRETFNPALPLDVLFASSRVIDFEDGPTVAYLRSLPAGQWSRIFEPQRPFDGYFPPRIDALQLTRGGDHNDIVEIGAPNFDLDDPGGASRDAVVRRAEGLEGWKVWLEDSRTGRRISVVRTLEGVEATPRLHTTGWGTSLVGVDAVVSPPDGFIAVPALRTPLDFGGLKNLDYPTLRAAIALEGLVAAGADGDVLLAVASRVTFSSVSVIRANGDADPKLQYATTVSTDDRGRFATVLPPGTYDVTVEPSEGTGFASSRTQHVVADATPLTLTPPRRTTVRGLAVLTDGRPAAGASILAMAEPLADFQAQPRPRPGRARTDDAGEFAFELDPGQYVFTVIPQNGTGFPRVVTRATIPFEDADLGAFRIPPPTRLALQFRDPSNLARAIAGARVRIFATPETNPDGAPVPALEIGSATTDARGHVEILLAQRPR